MSFEKRRARLLPRRACQTGFLVCVALFASAALTSASALAATSTTTAGGLQLSQSVAGLAQVGEPLAYTLTVTNTSTADVTNIFVGASVPQGAKLGAITSAGLLCERAKGGNGSGGFLCFAGALGAGAATTVGYSVIPSNAGVAISSAVVSNFTGGRFSAGSVQLAVIVSAAGAPPPPPMPDPALAVPPPPTPTPDPALAVPPPSPPTPTPDPALAVSPAPTPTPDPALAVSPSPPTATPDPALSTSATPTVAALPTAAPPTNTPTPVATAVSELATAPTLAPTLAPTVAPTLATTATTAPTATPTADRQSLSAPPTTR